MPTVPGFRRRLILVRVAACGMAVAVTAGVTAGCAGFNKAFGKREAIVHFQQGTPKSVRLAVRAACSHIPQATPEPLPTDKRLSDFVNDVRYRIDNASDAELSQLESCLSRFPSVSGVETPQDQNS